MKRSKSSVKPGDIIHIIHMFGESNYADRVGVVRSIDSLDQIHGSWGGLALLFTDDWEIISEEEAKQYNF